MSRDMRVPLRAEDSASWEEFQARYIAEIRREDAPSRSPKKWLWMLAAEGVGLLDIILWIGVAQGSSPGRWIALPFAVLLIFPVIFCLARSPNPRGVRKVTNRERELYALREEWKARADRGEIPMTTLGGPKVWQDQ